MTTHHQGITSGPAQDVDGITEAPALAGYTVSEVARALRIGRRRVRELIRRGELAAIDVGRDLSRRPRLIVLAEDLRRWVESRRAGPPPRQPRRRRRAPGQIDYYPD